MEVHINEIFDPDTLETIAETQYAYVTRAYFCEDADRTRAIAIKSASTLPEYSKEPHDIVKELRVLSTTSHVNVVELLGHTFDPATSSIHFWMPWIPYSLADLVNFPLFSPHLLPFSKEDETTKGVQAAEFSLLARSLIFQLISGVDHLHTQGIAHRDIKPKSALLTPGGCIKLIDFGVSWNESIASSSDLLWPESPTQMYFDVCTGPYRPPELLFGATAYDAFAVDLWSLGTTFAEFFTPLRLVSDWDDDEDNCFAASTSEGRPKEPFIIRSSDMAGPDCYWSRDPLFDSTRGSIGLAWSIFQVRGTPTEEIWPTFTSLPDAQKISFQSTPVTDLAARLPNLPLEDRLDLGGSHFPPPSVSPSALDLLHRFLVYPPEQRLKAAEALQHPWFTTETLILPEGYPADSLPSQVHVQQYGLSDLIAKRVSQ